MNNNAVLQVRIDSTLKKEAEELYGRLGTSLSEAVRMFLVQSLEVQGLPFELKMGIASRRALHAYGIANGFSDKSKIAMEKNAWADAAERKHEDSRR